MAIDLTQFVDGDDVLVTVRGRVFTDASIGGVWVRAADSNIDLGRHAVKAEHVTPEIHPQRYYLDGTGNLFVGHRDGHIFGPLASQHARKYGPTEIMLIRGLRPAEVRPVVPA